QRRAPSLGAQVRARSPRRAHRARDRMSFTLRVAPARAQTMESSFMPKTAAEPIQVGALTVRFHVDADASGGSVSVFECDVPANARMPAPHSHNEFDETVFGLD